LTLAVLTASVLGPAVPPPEPARADGSWVVAENLLPGTTDWRIPNTARRGIAGFADRVSATAGEQVQLFVDTKKATFDVVLYRLGWYQGAGGREIWRATAVPGTDQPDPTVTTVTNTVETEWAPSVALTIDPSWPTGLYVFRLATSTGGAGVIPFVVRDDASTSALLYQVPTITWQAYNEWGGHGLYEGPDGLFASRSRVVTFDRPYSGRGWGGLMNTLPFVVQAEQAGLDVSYWTDLDLHVRASLLPQHRALITLDHDEYWSTAMRDGATAARAAGVNIAFLGANAAYRKIRVEPSSLGTHRRIVNYKVASEDPLFGVNDLEVTSDWRRGPRPRAESSLLGAMYACNPVRGAMAIPDADIWPFAGSGLADGATIPDAVDMEFDKVFPKAPTPASIEVLGHSPVTCRGLTWFHDMTYYTAASGGGVLNVGSQGWGKLLRCTEPTLAATCNQAAVTITRNVLDLFATGPAALTRPSVPNAAAYGYVLTKPQFP
jgi:hypothetical protein